MSERTYFVTMASDRIDKTLDPPKTAIFIHGCNITMIPDTRADGVQSKTLHARAPVGDGKGLRSYPPDPPSLEYIT